MLEFSTCSVAVNILRAELLLFTAAGVLTLCTRSLEKNDLEGLKGHYSGTNMLELAQFNVVWRQ